MADLISAFKLQIGSGTDESISFTNKAIVKDVAYHTAISSCKITATFAAGTVKYSTTSAAAAASGTALTTATQSGAIDLSTNHTIYLHAVNGATTEDYTVTVNILPATAGACDNITKVGWFAAKCFSGDLDDIDSSGKISIVVPKDFNAKYVISINFSGEISGGTKGASLHGNYDLANNKLYVYSGTSAFTTKTPDIKYQVILMQ